jgi:flagellar hook-associated protein 1 FlgK
MGLSIGLDTAVTGLRAAQLAIDTTAHNVANANTEGYSRQEVLFRAIPPARSRWRNPGVPLQDIGLGVDASRIRRLRDALLDVQYRDVRRGYDQYQAEAAALRRAETALSEPSDLGLQQQLVRFFNTFRDLAAHPESIAARAATIEQGVTLSTAFQRTYALLAAQRTDLDAAVDVKVQEINEKAQEVAALNQQIQLVTLAGGTPNDLLDRRDLLLDDLAGLAGVTVQDGPSGAVDVLIGGRKLVDGVTANTLAAVPDPGNNNFKKVVWAADNADAGITAGEVAGIIRARDVHVTGLMTALDTLAGALIAAVNARHQSGYGLNGATGLNFFTGSGAADIAVNPTLQGSPESLAAADTPGEPGNPNTARAIAAVQDALLMNGGTATLDDYYRATVAALGVSASQAEAQMNGQEAVLKHIDAERQAVMGVSVDEEMSNLIKFQRAYQAAARVISTVDEMLDTLINRT